MIDYQFILIADQSYIGSIWLRSGVTLVDGLWYHVAGVYDSKSMKGYVNGREEGSTFFAGGDVSTFAWTRRYL